MHLGGGVSEAGRPSVSIHPRHQEDVVTSVWGLTWLGRAQRSQIGGPRDPQRCARNTAFVSPGILLGELKLYYVVLAHPKMGLIWSHRRWISSLAFQKYWLTKASRPCGTTTEVGDAKEGNFHCICGDRESKVGSALIAGRVTKTCPFASLQHWSKLLVYVVLLGLSHAILFNGIHLNSPRRSRCPWGIHHGFAAWVKHG
jgi:hypothetical protein